MKLQTLGIVTKVPVGWTSPKNKQLRQAYNSWTMMLHRCFDTTQKGFEIYGGRGITVSKQWFDFEVFIKDIGLPPTKKHSIDRINTNGHYEPKNCHWATRIEQVNNTSQNMYLTLNGKTQTAAQWGRELNMQPKLIRERIRILGWSAEKALTTKTNGYWWERKVPPKGN